VADEKTSTKDKDMEEEVSQWPPVSIFFYLFKDIEIS
jgi:hypothetical protein